VPQDFKLSVGDGDVDGRRADVDANEAQVLREANNVRPPSTARCGKSPMLDETQLSEPVEFEGQLGTGERYGITELCARARAVVAE
jgi:hypothetical protein